MSRIEELYKEMILEHNRNPRNFREIDPCSHRSHGVNPLCGDDYHLYLKVEKDIISDVGFKGSGCAISKSSGSLMTSLLKGKPISEANEMKNSFLLLLTSEVGGDDLPEGLGKLRVFEGVKKFPIRVKCATLIWHALEAALHQTGSGAVSTE
ncbi:MAG: nitrogen fixation NifU-like protein [Candidatus Marinamargulisbacteria bacterium]|jgi:nitrogen fixation NifU-like protein